jgi:hypothetical protein
MVGSFLGDAAVIPKACRREAGCRFICVSAALEAGIFSRRQADTGQFLLLMKSTSLLRTPGSR